MTGSNFVVGDTTVLVDGVAADTQVLDKISIGSRLTFVVPPGVALGRATIAVTTSFGTAVLPESFTVLEEGNGSTTTTAPGSPTTGGGSGLGTGGGSSGYGSGSGSGGGTLPRTGSDSGTLVPVGSALLLGGLTLLIARRRMALRAG